MKNENLKGVRTDNNEIAAELMRTYGWNHYIETNGLTNKQTKIIRKPLVIIFCCCFVNVNLICLGTGSKQRRDKTVLFSREMFTEVRKNTYLLSYI